MLPNNTKASLFTAATLWSVTGVRELLDQGADPNEREPSQGLTPIFICISKDVLKTAEFLLLSGANPNVRAISHNMTPLLAAVSLGKLEFVKLLLEFGADPSLAESQFGVTALILAKVMEFPDIVRVLENWQSDRVHLVPPALPAASTTQSGPAPTTMDEARIGRIVSLADHTKGEIQQAWTAESIFGRLEKAIIGNERYKRSLAICLSDFMGESMLRNHLLVSGSSGTGKTYLLEQCLPDFGLPYYIIDASTLVPAGIKGLTLSESLTEFFKTNSLASRRAVIVLDEFDKISEMANGGDIQKSHSIQSELLTLIQGKREGCIDTRNCIWILAGAFAFTQEMKTSPPKIIKNDLLKYGFKNELLGRITKMTSTEVPTVEQVVKRVANDKVILSFARDLMPMGFFVEFEDRAFLELAMATQSPDFGMRIVPTVVSELKESIIFGMKKGRISVTPEMIRVALRQ